MMKVAVFPNPWSTSWFRENLQEGGIMAGEEKLWEEAGFINCLQARSEDMVSGATCPDKPGPAHQELSRPRKQSAAVKVILIAAKVIFISEKDNCDQQQKIIWSGLEVESNDRKPPLMTSATKHDDGTHLGRGLKEKLASEKIAAVKLGSCLIPWCKTNDKVAKFVWQNPHRLSDQHHSSSCHIILWNIGVWKKNPKTPCILYFFRCTYFSRWEWFEGQISLTVSSPISTSSLSDLGQA